MQVISNPLSGKIIVTVVCSLHGEEIFPVKLFKYLEKHINEYPGLKIILAHEAAIKKKRRFLDTDLNRSFPGRKNGNREEKLAYQLNKEIRNCKYLLDIHTSVSDVTMTPIVTSMNTKIKRVINLYGAKNVAYVKPPLADQSLIGQIDNGVSLECKEAYAKKPQVMRSILRLIKDLMHDKKHKPATRKVFTVTGTVSKDTPMPKDAKNFKFVKELGVYPFLYHKDSYRDIHCLAATKIHEEKI